MAEELRYTVFETASGWTGVLGSERGLRCVTLPQRTQDEAYRLLGEAEVVSSPESFADLARRFRLYFEGKRVEFPDRLDLPRETPFQKSVWQATRTIPHGETRSYAWVAAKINNPQAARAVGQALGQNPCLIVVPCHRVLASSGKLGGFGGGMDMKRYLLSLEGGKCPKSAVPAGR